MSLTVARQTLSASAAGLANASAFSSLVRVFQESSRLELAEHAIVLAVVLSVTNTAYKVRFIVSCPSHPPLRTPLGFLGGLASCSLVHVCPQWCARVFVDSSCRVQVFDCIRGWVL